MRCRGWQQEAALRMLENNLHPDVAERPQDLVVYGGIGKAARSPEALAAIKARTAVENAAHVVAIELVCGAQGLEFHRPLRSTDRVEAAVERIRAVVPRVEEDRSLAGEVAVLADGLRTGEVVLA